MKSFLRRAVDETIKAYVRHEIIRTLRAIGATQEQIDRYLTEWEKQQDDE